MFYNRKFRVVLAGIRRQKVWAHFPRQRVLKTCIVAEEMTKWLRALAAFVEDWGSPPSTHIVANKHHNLSANELNTCMENTCKHKNRK